MSDQQTITEMFNDISPHYDFLNHLLSFNADRRWRRITSKQVSKRHPSAILDVATGTADLAIRMAKDMPSAKIIGVDLSKKMLEIGNQKIAEKQLSQRIRLEAADAAYLPYSDNSFDTVTAAFGVRNFSDLEQGLREMFRVAKNGGTVFILEFSQPNSFGIKAPYRFYAHHLLPLIGQIVSRNKNATSYLPSSIDSFPDTQSFKTLLLQNGLTEIQFQRFFGGIATLYQGLVEKKSNTSQ